MFKKIIAIGCLMVLVLAMALPVEAARVRKATKKAKSKTGFKSSGGSYPTSVFVGGGYKYISLEHFGIKIVKKGFYSHNGTTTSGSVIDPAKAGYSDVFHNAQMGDGVEATYLGNGQVQVRNVRSGESATIEVREKVR